MRKHRAEVKNGDFEKIPYGDHPDKLMELKHWQQTADNYSDAGFNIKHYGSYLELPTNHYDQPFGAVMTPIAIGIPEFGGLGVRGWHPPQEHFLDMESNGHNSSLFQDIKHLRDDQPLKLSFDYFDLAKYHGLEESDDSFYGASTLKVYWNNKQVGEISGNNSEVWANFSVQVEAGQNGEGELKIYEKGTAGDGHGIAIDNVSVEPLHHKKQGGNDHKYDDMKFAPVEELAADTSEVAAADISELSLDTSGGYTLGNLVKNGSFEYHGGKFYEVDEGGYEGFDKIKGWRPVEKHAEDNFEIHHEDIHDDTPGGGTTDGDYYLDTGLTPGNMGIKQQIKGVEAGDLVEVSIDYFDHAMAEGKHVESSRLEVWWDDTLLGQIDGGNANNWATTSFQFVVPGNGYGKEILQADFSEDGGRHSGGRNELILKEVGTNDNLGLGIDNVQVHIVDRPMDYYTTTTVDSSVEESTLEEADVSDEEAAIELELLNSQADADMAVA